MKYVIAATRLPAKNLEVEKHYFTGRWAPAVPSENLEAVPVIGMQLSHAKAFDTQGDAYIVREEIKSASNGTFRNCIQFRVYEVEDKEIFEARLKG